jgi:hypothetical protein
MRRFPVRAGPLIFVALVLKLATGCKVPTASDAPGAALPRGEADSRWNVPSVSSPAAEPASSGEGFLTRFDTGGEPAGEAGEEAAPEAAPKRLMIYTGRFELLVANVKDAVSRFLKSVTDAGGYLQSREDSRVVCRVPASRFQEVVDALPSFGILIRESIQAQDATKKYYDLRLRIETAEKARDRLLALLERAEEVEDILRIEGEVRRLTEEIERLKGELKYLSEQIAFSTVEVNFRANAPEPRPVHRRVRSRFDWINRIGVEHVLEDF